MEAVEQIARHIASYKGVALTKVVKEMKGGIYQPDGFVSLNDVVSAINKKGYPSNIIIAGDKPEIPLLDPLRRILSGQCITPEYVQGYEKTPLTFFT